MEPVSFYFHIGVEDFRIVKEFFYRVKPDTEYRSTGFLQQTNPATGLPYASLVIPNNKRGLLEIDVKFTDAQNKEQGPYSFEFNTDQLEIAAIKDSLRDNIDNWFSVRRRVPDLKTGRGWTSVDMDRMLLTLHRRSDAIAKVMYGINKETPDMTFDLWRELTGEVDYDWFILSSEEDSIHYVSEQIFFNDGTSTDVRIFSKTIQ